MSRTAFAILLTTAAVAHAQTVPITLGKWKPTAPLPAARAAHQVVAHGRHLFVLGGYSYGGSPKPTFKLYDDVHAAAINDKGEIDGWKPLAAFSGARSGHACVVHDGVLYAIAGSGKDGTYLADVQSAAIHKDGTLGPWKTSAQKLRQPRSSAAAAVRTNKLGEAFLVVVGGVGEVRGRTVHFDDVEFAPIRKDGTVGEWLQGVYHFRGGRSAAGVAVHKDRLYVLGGWGELIEDDIYGDVQYADLDAGAEPSPWRTSGVGLRVPLYGNAVVPTGCRLGDVLLSLGGNSGEGNVSDAIQALVLQPDGKPAGCYLLRQQLPAPVWGHGCAVVGGRLYVLGGGVRGGGQTADVHFAELTTK